MIEINQFEYDFDMQELYEKKLLTDRLMAMFYNDVN